VPLFTRRPSLPEPLRARLALPPGDRVLASVRLTDGGWAVATRRAVYVASAEPEATGPQAVPAELVRHPWADVDRATLDAESATITVHWVAGWSQPLALVESGARDFAQVLRERVQSSVVHSEKVDVVGGTVRVALRRDEDGGFLSQVIGEGRVDLADPGVAALVDATERRVRAEAGLAG
jgi:hypothetical protein